MLSIDNIQAKHLGVPHFHITTSMFKEAPLHPVMPYLEHPRFRLPQPLCQSLLQLLLLRLLLSPCQARPTTSPCPCSCR